MSTPEFTHGDRIKVGGQIFRLSEIPDFLRVARRQKDHTLRDAAAQMGLNHTTLSRIENGSVRPQGQTLLKLLSYIFGEEAQPSFVEPGGYDTLDVIGNYTAQAADLSEAEKAVLRFALAHIRNERKGGRG